VNNITLAICPRPPENGLRQNSRIAASRESTTRPRHGRANLASSSPRGTNQPLSSQGRRRRPPPAGSQSSPFAPLGNMSGTHAPRSRLQAPFLPWIFALRFCGDMGMVVSGRVLQPERKPRTDAEVCNHRTQITGTRFRRRNQVSFPALEKEKKSSPLFMPVRLIHDPWYIPFPSPSHACMPVIC
jgi:hypothetical protein